VTHAPTLVDPAILERIREEETKRFETRTARSRALLERSRAVMPCGVPMAWMAGLYRHAPIFAVRGEGAWFEDADGNRYLDMNLADLAGSLGFSPPAVGDAVRRRTELGTAFLLPTEDAIVASELLATRTGLPCWQYTGSASAANIEAIRLARLATGRERVLLFTGKYHGHIDETLVQREEGNLVAEGLGLPSTVTLGADLIPFNDLEALARALYSRHCACLLAEPMLTNCNLVFPDKGFWEAALKLLRGTGTLLVIDEAHTHSFAYGGLTREWGLTPDIVVLGKGLGSGIAFGAYGMRAELAELSARHLEGDGAVGSGLAIGGTTYGNALALAAARAALEHHLTPEAYARTAQCGARLGRGLEKLFRAHGLDWRAPFIGGRSAWVLFPELPRNAEESLCSLDREFVDTRRLFMANRGVWEAIWSAGPAASFTHTFEDIDRYLEVAEEFLTTLTR
jgi:glutamate-1-semialdehyde aminotransferase